MNCRSLHPWNVTPREAILIQNRLRSQVIDRGVPKRIRTVAGADISWGEQGRMGFAGVIVFGFPDLEEIERVSVRGPATFPYVPGLLSFREGPLLVQAFERLATEPDVILFDGQGLAHPRRMGIASHMGLILDRPAIGCAKSRLTGEHREPGSKRGNRAALRDKEETIGAVLRTRTDVKPIFVSVGHRVSLDEAIRLALRCGDGFRVPKPTRLADHFVGRLRAEYEDRGR
ncbi:deoxyribonuclease V [Candidatus Sumerlaeota bacterium]|nr:deoxyribonuclease V [Candidatus Sumerlaeota bacterium]